MAKDVKNTNDQKDYMSKTDFKKNIKVIDYNFDAIKKRLNEQNKNIKSLIRSAQKLEHIKDIKATVKKLTGNFDSIEQNIEDLQKRLNDEVADISNNTVRADEFETLINDNRKKIESVEEKSLEIDMIKNEIESIKDFSKRLKILEKDLESFPETQKDIKSAIKSNESFEKKIKSMEENFKEQKADIGSLKKIDPVKISEDIHKSVLKEMESFGNSIDEEVLDAVRKVNDNETKIDSLRTEVDNLISKNDNQSNDKSILQEQLEEIKRNTDSGISTLKVELERTAEEIRTQSQNEEVFSLITEMQKQIEEQNKIIEELKSEKINNSQQKEINRLKENLIFTGKEIKAQQKDIDRIKKLIEKAKKTKELTVKKVSLDEDNEPSAIKKIISGMSNSLVWLFEEEESEKIKAAPKKRATKTKTSRS